MFTVWVNPASFNLRTSNAVCFWVPTFDYGGELVDIPDCTFAASLSVCGKLRPSIAVPLKLALALT